MHPEGLAVHVQQAASPSGCMFGAFGAALAALVMAMEEVKVGKNQISLTCFFDIGLFDHPIVKFAA